MSKNEKPRKIKNEKQYTRAQAEKALSAGIDPQQFVKHPNAHVRIKSWNLMGRPLPEDEAERDAFLLSLQSKKLDKPEEKAEVLAKMKFKFLSPVAV